MKVDLPSWSVRNPLGTIALFISLIYGICALLLASAIGSLQARNETVLVAFVVVFPFAILGVFTWLVASHHKKLYGPGDYRTDEGFLQASQPNAPELLGEKLQEEVVAETNALQAEIGSEDLPSDVAPSTPLPTNENARLVQEAYIAENLVFQELQTRLNGSVERNVLIEAGARRFRVDGLIRTEKGTHIVETVFVRSKWTVARRIREANAVLAQIAEAFPQHHPILCVVVGPDGPGEKETLDRIAAISVRSEFAVFYFKLEDLFAKYGLPSVA